MKRFLVRTLVGAIPLLLLILGSLYYYFLIRPELTGDLGQLGKIAFGTEYDARIGRPQLDGSMVRPFEPGAPVGRIVTIGDSFSQQEERGYQNFLTHRLGEPVTNIRLIQGTDPEQAALDLLQAGFFDTLPEVKWVIVESVERALVDRCLNLTPDRRTAESPLLREDDAAGSDSGSGNGLLGRAFRQSKDWMLLNLGLARNPVCTATLDRPCFTLPERERTLYFYKDDLDRLSVTDAELATVRESLRTLHERFQARGIELLFLMAVDKYECYQHFIVDKTVDNSYPQRPLGSRLQALDSLEFFVNPLPALRERLEAGEQDLYMAHDTHWSQKGARLAADLLYEKIRLSESEQTADDENRPNSPSPASDSLSRN